MEVKNSLCLLDTLGRKNRKLEDKKCESCGKVFRPRVNTARFCSRPCLWSKNGGHNKKRESWFKNSKGYIEGRVWVDEHTQIRVKQHRWIVECYLGIKLDPSVDVHHINGIKDDNRIENLEIIEHGKHSTIHNFEREYKKGYKMKISEDERRRRSLMASELKPWLAKARGEQ